MSDTSPSDRERLQERHEQERREQLAFENALARERAHRAEYVLANWRLLIIGALAVAAGLIAVTLVWLITRPADRSSAASALAERVSVQSQTLELAFAKGVTAARAQARLNPLAGTDLSRLVEAFGGSIGVPAAATGAVTRLLTEKGSAVLEHGLGAAIDVARDDLKPHGADSSTQGARVAISIDNHVDHGIAESGRDPRSPPPLAAPRRRRPRARCASKRLPPPARSSPTAARDAPSRAAAATASRRPAQEVR